MFFLGIGYINSVCAVVQYRIAISEYCNTDMESAEVPNCSKLSCFLQAMNHF